MDDSACARWWAVDKAGGEEDQGRLWVDVKQVSVLRRNGNYCYPHT